MIRVNVFVEGQTEETFVRDVLYEPLRWSDVYLTPILVHTSAKGRGGVVRYAQIKPQLRRKCLEDPSSYVTTMFDLYRLPKDSPGLELSRGIIDPLARAAFLEEQMQVDVNCNNFVPNLIVHEFEGLLFSAPDAFSEWFDKSVIEDLYRDRQRYPSPEHINDGPESAPSKRIARYCPMYDKPLHGALIASSIGLDNIRRQCRHFDAWLARLADLAGIG